MASDFDCTTRNDTTSLLEGFLQEEVRPFSEKEEILEGRDSCNCFLGEASR